MSRKHRKIFKCNEYGNWACDYAYRPLHFSSKGKTKEAIGGITKLAYTYGIRGLSPADHSTSAQKAKFKKVVEVQDFNMRDAERMKRELQAVERNIEEVEIERNKWEEKCWDLNAVIGTKWKELDALQLECNQAIRSQFRLPFGVILAAKLVKYTKNEKSSTEGDIFAAEQKLYKEIDTYCKVLDKKVETHAVRAIKEGKIQKDKKKLQGAKGKDKGKTKLAESKKLKHEALSMYVGNGMRAAVEAIGSFD
ncbi:kinetochore protein NDC80 [Tanacetum coccineum]